MAEQNLRVGVSRCDITPPLGIAHGNWSAQVHQRAEGIDLPLWCTVLAASDGHEEILLVEWDLLYPPKGEELALYRKRIGELTGVPPSHIRMSSSHTHSGPSQSQPWFDAGAEMVKPYNDSLVDKVAGACWAARRAMQPALVAGAKGSCPVNVCRRKPWKDRMILGPNPDGYSDHEVGVVRIDDLKGRPLAVIVHFSAHPTILAWENRLISTDYPGTLRRTVESMMNSPCLFLQGSTGNQCTICDYSGRTEDARWIGRQIGIEAARVAGLIETRPTKLAIRETAESSWTMGRVERVPEGTPDGTVRCVSRTVPLPLWTRGPATEAELARLAELRQRLADVRASGAPEEEVRAANREVRRASLEMWIVEERSRGTSVDLEFQAMRLGNIALLGIPCEPFNQLGAEIKRRSPFPLTLFSGYTNGFTGYMPNAEAYPEGGYEVWVTPYAPEAAGITVEKGLEIISQLAN
jgi:hypothetical protein